MSRSELEIRVERLEREVDLLKGRTTNEDWKKIIGTFAEDKSHEQAMRLGREYRESQRPSKRRS